MTVGTKSDSWRPQLASREELRFYLTDDALTKLPMDKAGGSVEVWTDELMESTLVKFPLTPGTAGATCPPKSRQSGSAASRRGLQRRSRRWRPLI